MQLSRTRSVFGLLGFALMMAWAGRLSAQNNGPGEPFEEPQPALENPILRDYYRKQYLSLRSEPELTLSDHFLEQYVDQQTKHFIGEIQGKMEKIRRHLSIAREIQQNVMSNPQARRTLAARWSQSLDHIGDDVEGLRDLLSFIFTDLDSKAKYDPRIEGTLANGFEPEMEFIEEQIAQAEQRITNYFFYPTNTVALDELRGENMLVHLYRARKMAKKLEDAIKRLT